jgi:hypothetical protein
VNWIKVYLLKFLHIYRYLLRNIVAKSKWINFLTRKQFQSRLVYQSIHIVWISLQKLSLLAILYSFFYQCHICLECFTPLLHLWNKLWVFNYSICLHYFYNCSINYVGSLQIQAIRLDSSSLNISWHLKTSYFWCFIFELKVKLNCLTFRLYFCLIPFL